MQDERQIRYQIADTLCDLAARIIRRESPFNRFFLKPEVSGPLYVKYLEYADKIETSLSNNYVRGCIECAKYIIREEVTGEARSFKERYMEVRKIQNQIRALIHEKEKISKPIYSSWSSQEEENIRVNQIVKQIMKKRKPEFLYEKSLVYPGMLPFLKNWLDDNGILICIDRGTHRNFLSFEIGIRKPLFTLDIALFFGGGAQSRFRYRTSEDVVKNTNMGLDFIDLLLPHVLERVGNILTNS